MSVYDPKTIASTQLTTKSDQCFEFLKNGKCRWGATCRFAHGDKGNVQVARKRKGTTQTVVEEKSKKPKHLKRKLQQAQESQDEEKLRELELERQHLQGIKDASAKLFKKTCKRLVKQLYGEEKFDESKFQEYIKAGYSKEKLLKKLGISEDEQKRFKAKDKATGGDEETKKNEGSQEYNKKCQVPNDKQHTDRNLNTDGNVAAKAEVRLKVDKKSCKKLIKKLYGDERWDEAQYDELVGQGMKGNALMEALGIGERHLKNFK